MVISPDEGAMDRAVYLANNLALIWQYFYKAEGLLQSRGRTQSHRGS